MLKQAEQYWKMLDDMSESDPNAYKNFVDTNIKNGQSEMKKEQDAVRETRTHKVKKDDYQFSIKIFSTLENLFGDVNADKNGKANTQEQDFVNKILKEEKKKKDAGSNNEPKYPENA